MICCIVPSFAQCSTGNQKKAAKAESKNPKFLIVFSSIFIIASTGLSQEHQASSSHVPRSISETARKFLMKGPTLPESSLQTLKDWQTRRSAMEALGKSWYEASSHKYSGPPEILEFEGDHGQVVRVHKMVPEKRSTKNADKAILYLHGGGFCFGSPKSTYCVSAPAANLTGLCVYSVDYRLAPEHPFPAALNDCVTAYEEIVKQVGPKNLGVFGESAGASLGLTMLLKARDEDLPMPAALGCISPCVDLTLAGDTITTLEQFAPVLSAKKLKSFLGAYAGTTNRRHPLLSPLFAEYTPEFPPTMIQTGTRDQLLSDCVRMHQKLKSAGVDVELSVREGMWHGYHIIPSNDFPEAKVGVEELANFFRRKLKLDAAKLDLSSEAQDVLQNAPLIAEHLRDRGGILRRRSCHPSMRIFPKVFRRH